MKALVISDTHIKNMQQLDELNRAIEPYLKDVDMIIHAGDSVSSITVDYLKGLKTTYAVAGNMDSLDLRGTLPDKLIINLGKFKIGVTHGWGSSQGLKERIFELFKDSEIDAIIFGHSHEPFIGKKNGILLLNPGSPTDKRFAEKNTIALLEGNGDLTAQIIDIE